MKTKTAIIREQPAGAPREWEVVEVDLEDPRQDELLIKMVASGLCHSDDHLATGDIPVGVYPFAGGHEGAGIVEQVGPNTPGYEVGDHVVMSFLPGCGRCRWCASGMQNLCDLGATLLAGSRADGSYRMSLDGAPVGQMCGISTFSEFSVVSVDNAVKVADDLPLEKACLVGCGVGTGWGSAVNSAKVYPGHTVIVMGIGGIGINAVQGAAHAGASHVIAVDPVEFKREKAMELGATEAFADMAEATEFAQSVTNGQGADSAIVTVGVTKGEHIAQAFQAIRKAGTVVVTGLGDITEVGIPISPGELTLFQKRIQGSLFGESSPSRDILAMLELYRAGKVRLDELVTNTYTLDTINEGYADMHAGKNLRGVLIHNH
ncbi:MAG: NDMA-dependent alcohol dehydrogenase [Actinomycetota bacterium]|nr:NDMA-dependent alcohol dehydrogenase [Acidimicrobiia bacterium]MDQ3469513.1 NDMA-dependent alcohol dehydrogenase [Actinomycetota bacterium]